MSKEEAKMRMNPNEASDDILNIVDCIIQPYGFLRVSLQVLWAPNIFMYVGPSLSLSYYMQYNIYYMLNIAGYVHYFIFIIMYPYQTYFPLVLKIT